MADLAAECATVFEALAFPSGFDDLPDPSQTMKVT